MAYTFKHGDRPLDGYTVQRAVGRGGFGEVYYAISDGGREVALKYLRDNPQVELRGVSNCINLKSPHLVSIFDVRKADDGNYIIIMEYCSGPSLRDLLIAEPNGFGAQKAAFFAREIAKGLSYLHDRGIVHRDLKPGNIFYDDGYVKIGDYGLSKFISVSRHSAQTASVGTVHYMAPEIGSGNYSRGVDIYALGVILYEMLMGKVPFEGSSMGEILMKHLTTQPEVENLPHPFGQVIHKSLEKDPHDRYQTIEEMMGDLLEAAAVKESLAGFSPQSLEGAIRRDETLTVHSPVPSPNPMPRAGGPPPPPMGTAPLPDRVAKRVERVSRKIDQKLGRMGNRLGKPPRQAAGRHEGPAGLGWGVGDSTPVERRKRLALVGILGVGLAIGLGILVGTLTGDDEPAASAGMLAVAMPGAVLLGMRLIKWFDVQYGPKWAGHMIHLATAAPLTALGAAPIMDRYSESGVAVWLGVLAVAVFANWDRQLERATVGELSFGTAIWTAFGALVATAIANGILDGREEQFLFISAAVAGVASLVVQASSWLQLAPNGVAPVPDPGASPAGDPRAATAPRAESPEAHGDPSAGAGSSAGARSAAAFSWNGEEVEDVPRARLRWLLTRAFWGLVAFVSMGISIFTFVTALIAEQWSYHERTAGIVGCIGAAAFMLFALRKTGPVKREGFWRETLRPFLISAALFGIGAAITAISREWHHGDEYGRCVSDEGRAALITGLVLWSCLFLVLTLFTGRRKRSSPLIEGGAGRFVLEDDGSFRRESFVRAAEAPSGGPEMEPGSGARPRRAHRGPMVMVLGILGVATFCFPLGAAAWIMGERDLGAMQSGEMDPSGMGMVRAGKVCGMVNVFTSLAVTLIVMLTVVADVLG